MESQDQELCQAIEDTLFDNLNDLCCPISHQVMTDPVFAADNHTYNRPSIEQFFRIARNIRPGAPIRSPLTGEVFGSEELRPNLTVRKYVETVANALKSRGTGISELLLDASRVNRNISKGNTFGVLSSVFFDELDALMKEDLFQRLKLQTPQLVAVGDEKSGVNPTKLSTMI